MYRNQNSYALSVCLLALNWNIAFPSGTTKMKRKSFVIEWYGSVQAGNCWTDYSFTFENCCSNEAFAVFLFNTRSSWSTKPQLTVNRKKVILFHLHRSVNSFFYRALLLLLWPYIRLLFFNIVCSVQCILHTNHRWFMVALFIVITKYNR